ncbi:hypothetical protein DCAR_0310561 [Daucus carota subsp. sativus]|uniref:Uncharacterized protein n=1 Tax=Daucus carota subsp. sativus TaxID=79200 RepID=A0A165ZZN0_DAUCS|nr:hypothetical protein DCAR_0310561 [Daucus carota subsp. sativus]
MVSLHIVESLEPIPGQPLLQFSPDQAYKQKFLLLNYWKDCHDAWLHTGGCLVDILKLLHGGLPGGLPGGGGLPLDDPPAADAPSAPAPAGGSSAATDTATTVLDGDDDAGAGGAGGLPGIPGIGGGIPGIGGGIPGIGGGIPGIGGGLPGFQGPFSQVCCDALAELQKSCPGLAINPFYGPVVTKHCAAH